MSDRIRLSELLGQRLPFRARVERFEERTILVTSLTCEGMLVAEHLRLKAGKWSKDVQPGELIECRARVERSETEVHLVRATLLCRLSA